MEQKAPDQTHCRFQNYAQSIRMRAVTNIQQPLPQSFHISYTKAKIDWIR